MGGDRKKVSGTKMILEDHERKKFADYCIIQVDSSKLLVEQLEKMSHVEDLEKRRHLEELTKHERLRLVAFQIVAKYLGSAELQTIKG